MLGNRQWHGTKRSEELNKASRGASPQINRPAGNAGAAGFTEERCRRESPEIIDLYDDTGEACGTKVIVRVPFLNGMIGNEYFWSRYQKQIAAFNTQKMWNGRCFTQNNQQLWRICHQLDILAQMIKAIIIDDMEQARITLKRPAGLCTWSGSDCRSRRCGGRRRF